MWSPSNGDVVTKQWETCFACGHQAMETCSVCGHQAMGPVLHVVTKQWRPILYVVTKQWRPVLSCIPLVVETYSGWGQEAISTFARLSKLLGLRQRQPSTTSLNELYCRLSIVLMRQNAQALLAHAALPAVAREF